MIAEMSHTPGSPGEWEWPSAPSPVTPQTVPGPVGLIDARPTWQPSETSPPRPPAGPFRPRSRGLWGSVVAGGAAIIKFGSLLLKLGAFKGTLITMAISVVAYSIFFGPVFALGFVLLILVHELGHYRMAKRLGLPVSAPVFIPLLGALINMRRPPASVQQEATMALAGPAVGTAAAWLCLLGGVLLHSEFFAALGYLGCLINLFNLIPASPLDGGRVSAAISKWAQLVGMGVLVLYAVGAFTFGAAVSPVILIILLMAAFGTFSRFRQARRQPQYLVVATRTRWIFLGLYLGLVLVAGLGVLTGYPYLHYVQGLNFHF